MYIKVNETNQLSINVLDSLNVTSNLKIVSKHYF